MKLFLKFPVYAKIDSDCMDRAKVSKIVEEILYPQLKDFLLKAKIRSSVSDEISAKIGFPTRITVQTEVEILQNQISDPKS